MKNFNRLLEQEELKLDLTVDEHLLERTTIRQTLQSISAGIGGVLAHLTYNFDFSRISGGGSGEPPPLFGDESTFFGTVGYYASEAFSNIVSWVVDIVQDFFVPLGIVAAGAYIGDRLFRKYIDESVIAESVVEERERIAWDRLQEMIRERDDVLQTITQQELSPSEASERYGSTLERQTREIGENASYLYDFIQRHSADEMEISDREKNRLMQYLDKASKGLVSEYLAQAAR